MARENFWKATAIAAVLVAGGTPAPAQVIEDASDAILLPEQSGSTATERLLDVLVGKGTLTTEEADVVRAEAADDALYSVDVGGRLRVLAIPFDGDDYVEGVPGDPNLRTGFVLDSARLYADGHVGWSWLTYGMTVEFAEEGEAASIDVELLDAYIAVDEGLVPYHTIALGVARTPFSRQQLTSSSRLQFQDRSIVVEELGDRFIDRELGLSASGRFPLDGDTVFLKYGAGVFNGGGVDTLKGDDNQGKLFTFRAAVDLFRDVEWSEPDLQGEGPAASLGGGFFLDDAPASEFTGYTIDGVVKWEGLSVSGAWVAVDVEPDLGAGSELPDFTTDFSTDGWYVQGGYLILPHLLELAVRYDVFDGNDEVDDNEDVSAVTGAINLYLAGHDAKVGLEYIGRIEDEGASLDNDSLVLVTQLRF